MCDYDVYVDDVQMASPRLKQQNQKEDLNEFARHRQQHHQSRARLGHRR